MDTVIAEKTDQLDADFIQLLYSNLYQREASQEEITIWLGAFKAGKSYKDVYELFITSEEYSRLQGEENEKIDFFNLMQDILPLKIVDIGAQALSFEDHIYAPLVAEGGCEVIGFEPLEEECQQRQQQEPGVTMLPQFVGDGKQWQFHTTNFSATSSLFKPNSIFNQQFIGLDESCQVVATDTVSTERLDSIEQVAGCHFLKLDTQGSELIILQSAEQLLKQVLVVHLEAEFAPIYQDQPLFSDIDQFLRARNFELIDLNPCGRYRYKTDKPDGLRRSRLLWGEVIYMKTLPSLQQLGNAAIAQAAYMMAINYKKTDLANYLLAQIKNK